MVKRRERRVGGCEGSIVEECIWLKRGMEEAERLVRLLLANLRRLSDNCNGEHESV